MKTNFSLRKEQESLTVSEDTEPPGSIYVHNSSDEDYHASPPPAFYELFTSNDTINLAQIKGVKRHPKHEEHTKTSLFHARFFPSASDLEWNDWRWQLKNRITSIDRLEEIINLSEEEREAITRHKGALPMGITPYYASLLDRDDPLHPIRRSVVPVTAEYLRTQGEEDDPLAEDSHSPVPGIVHRYPDRVLFLVTSYCSTYCRYCTRSRMVGTGCRSLSSLEHWKGAIDYIEKNHAIRDVLLSGGDPLTLPDDRLEWLLSTLRRIPHIEVLRIGTKVPMVLPQRITPALLRMLRRYHPLWMSLHVIHPDELTFEASKACTRLADAGIPLGSQTVLLSGINDSVETMKQLVHGLMKTRVRPYYLYQCDPISGSAHFRTPVEKGLKIIKGLRGYTSGYAVPTYVIDAPGSGGKIPLIPDPVIGRDGDYVLLKNYEGKTYRYPDNGVTMEAICQRIAQGGDQIQ